MRGGGGGEKGEEVGGTEEHTLKRYHDTALMHELKQKVHERIVEEFGTNPEARKTMADDQLLKYIQSTFDLVLDERNVVLSHHDRDDLSSELLYDVLGLGPIEPLMQDTTVTEIMVNGPHSIYVEREGKLELTKQRFFNSEHVMRIIEKIVSSVGRRIDESSPMVDARLKDGSRVNAIIPPLSLSGPVITIRKFSVIPFTINDLVRFGTITDEMATLLEACVRARLSIIISGGTGSGKTTTLGVMSSFIPDDERIITVEDAAELQLRQRHVVTLESRHPNIEGKGAVSIRDLVRNALRMRPDRIVVGEVRGGEALDMLQAMNTGHEGSLTTLHSNSPRDTLSRLETMVLMSGMELPIRAVRDQISSAINLIIHQERMKDGKRRVTQLTEVLGMEGDTVTMQDIINFERTGIDANDNILGHYVSTGVIPKFIEKFKAYGIKLPLSLFKFQGVKSPNGR